MASIVRVSLNLSRPYDAEIAIKKLGGKIVRNLDNMAINASIKKEKYNKFIINLNGKDPYSMDRFIMAHTLGHLFLHMGFLVNKELWRNHKLFIDSPYYKTPVISSCKEKEADKFAMFFLIPIEEFIQQISNKRVLTRNNVKEIADYFTVRPIVVISMAREIGYISI
jgi:Zn-dependent peptidase ImmA (M78 family)